VNDRRLVWLTGSGSNRQARRRPPPNERGRPPVWDRCAAPTLGRPLHYRVARGIGIQRRRAGSFASDGPICPRDKQATKSIRKANSRGAPAFTEYSEYSEVQGNLDARCQVANPPLRYLLSQQSQPSPIMKRPAALWNWAGWRARCPRSGYLYTDSENLPSCVTEGFGWEK